MFKKDSQLKRKPTPSMLVDDELPRIGLVYNTRGRIKRVNGATGETIENENSSSLSAKLLENPSDESDIEREIREQIDEMKRLDEQLRYKGSSSSSVVSIESGLPRTSTHEAQPTSNKKASKMVSVSRSQKQQQQQNKSNKKLSKEHSEISSNSVSSDESYQPGKDKNKTKMGKNLKKKIKQKNKKNDSESSGSENESILTDEDLVFEESLDENEVKKRKNKNPTKIRNYFEEFQVFHLIRNGRKSLCWKAKCRTCTALIRDTHGTTSNFWSHLRRRHPNLELDVNHSSKNTRNSSVVTLTQEKFNEIIIIDLIIKGGLPLNIVENKGFLTFIGRLWPHIVISRKQIRNKEIPEMAEKVKRKLVKLLEKIKNVSLTIDFWTDRRKRTFMAVTCHFVDSDLALKRYLLCLKYITNSHTGANIEEWYQQTIYEYGLHGKVYRVTTDNASYMIKAFDITLLNVEKPDDSSSSEWESSYEQDEEEAGRLDRSVCEFNELLNDNGTRRIPCFIHTLQLAIKDGLSNRGGIGSALDKVSGIANASHRKDEVARFIYENKLKSIPLNCVTRWNGQLKMVKTVLEIAPKLNYFLDPDLILTSTERRCLKEFVRVMEPFEEATKKCEADYKPTINHVLPKIISLYNHLRYLASPESPDRAVSCKTIVDCMVESFNSRFSGIIEFIICHANSREDANVFGDKVFLLGAILDPNTKLYWIDYLPEKDDTEKRVIKEICKSIIIEEMVECDEKTQNQAQTQTQPTVLSQLDTNTHNRQAKSDKKLFSFRSQMIDQMNTTRASSNSNESKYLVELENYLSYLPDDFNPESDEDIDMMMFWHAHKFKYPFLANVYKKVMSCTASSAPSERVFSKAGLRMSPKRSRTSHETLSKLVYLDINYEIL